MADKSTPSPRPRAPHQLPPGRHKLGRSFVEANQRERILEAVTDVTSLAGYTEMSVEDILGTAGVSRRTFYDTFGGKEEAFLAALDGIGEQLLARVQAAYAGNDTFAGGVRDCLATFLDFITTDPRYGDMLLVESLAAGPAAIERRNMTMKRFAEMLRSAADRLKTTRRPPDLTAETIVGGIYEVVYSRVIAGEVRELPALLQDPRVLDDAAVHRSRGGAARSRESSES